MSLFDKKVDKQEVFQKVTRDKTKKEVRKLEEHMLKPEPIPSYKGKHPENYGIDALTVSIVFPSERIRDIFGKFLKISYSKIRKQQYVTDISLIINLVKQLDEGTLVYENGVFKEGRKTKSKRRKL